MIVQNPVRHIVALASALFATSLLVPDNAYAGGLINSVFGSGSQTTASTIAKNITAAFDDIPGLLASLAYIIALLLGIWGILKVKDHVENPQQTRLSEGVIRFAAGGFMFSLPTLYEAMRNAITGSGSGFSVGGDSLITGLSSIVGVISKFVPSQGINQIMSNIIASFQDVPGLISAAAFLIGLIMGIWGILNIKENIESGQNNPPLREGITRLLIGGALFSLPTVFKATKNAIEGDGFGVFDIIGDVLGIGSILVSTETGDFSCLKSLSGLSFGGIGPGTSGSSLGGVLCSSVINTSVIPAFLALVAYLLGLVLGLWAIFKLRDYVINPQQTQAWDFVSRFTASGAFFALPTVVKAVTNSIGTGLVPHTNTGFNEKSASGTNGLDNMLINLMSDAFGPATIVLNWFGYLAGTILIFIGISRLLKSSQEGPRGPGGVGTIMTFVVGGALISFSPMVTALGSSLFGSSGLQTTTYAMLTTTKDAMSQDVQDQVLLVISAVIKFMIFVGLVSIMRGMFLVRDVAEGNQQASLMAAMTHLIGGALAVNLGPLMNAVQSTLGIAKFGIIFG